MGSSKLSKKAEKPNIGLGMQIGSHRHTGSDLIILQAYIITKNNISTTVKHTLDIPPLC